MSAAESRWGEPLERTIVFPEVERGAVAESRWAPEVCTRIHFVQLWGEAQLVAVYFGTAIASFAKCWSQHSGILDPGQSLTVHAINARWAQVSYSELRDPPFGPVDP